MILNANWLVCGRFFLNLLAWRAFFYWMEEIAAFWYIWKWGSLLVGKISWIDPCYDKNNKGGNSKNKFKQFYLKVAFVELNDFNHLCCCWSCNFLNLLDKSNYQVHSSLLWSTEKISNEAVITSLDEHIYEQRIKLSKKSW
jgi:hypothetical protein